MNSATSVRTKKAQGGFFADKGGVEFLGCICGAFGETTGCSGRLQLCFKLHGFLRGFGSEAAFLGLRHHLLCPEPPFRRGVGHHGVEVFSAIVALKKNLQFFDCVTGGVRKAVLRGALFQAKGFCNKRPCLMGILEFYETADRLLQSRNGAIFFPIGAGFRTPRICVSTPDGRRCAHEFTEAKMTDDGIDKLNEDIAELHARIDAHRAVFTVLVTAIETQAPEVKADIMRGLSGFERTLRMTNERDAVLRELRAVREILESIGKPEDQGAV